MSIFIIFLYKFYKFQNLSAGIFRYGRLTRFIMWWWLTHTTFSVRDTYFEGEETFFFRYCVQLYLISYQYHKDYRYHLSFKQRSKIRHDKYLLLHCRERSLQEGNVGSCYSYIFSNYSNIENKFMFCDKTASWRIKNLTSVAIIELWHPW